MGRSKDKAGEQYWRRMVAERKASGLTVAAFCAQKGFSENSFYFWQKRLRGEKGGTDEPVFLPVTLRPAEPAGGEPEAARIEVMLACGQVITLPLSRENLAMVVDVLEERAC